MSDLRSAQLIHSQHPAPCQASSADGHSAPGAARRRIDTWLDQHAIAIDRDGQPVTSLFLADEVCGYRIEDYLLQAHSNDGELRDMSRQLARRHALGDSAIMLLHRALDTLRHELRQQPAP